MTPKKRTAGDWRAAFLAALRTSANVSQACAAASISRKTAYQHRERSEEFRAEWADAVEEACDWLEGEAHRRAHDGVDEPVIYQGKLMGVWVNERGDVVSQYTAGATQIPLTVKRYSDTLLIFLLKAHRPEKYRERIEHSGNEDAPIRVITVRGPTDGNGN